MMLQHCMRIVFLIPTTLPFAMVIGGFAFGAVHCEGCEGNLAGRAFIGLVFAVLTPHSLGFPPRNEGAVGEPYNVWPYIVPVWLALIAMIMVFYWRFWPDDVEGA